MIFWEKRWGRPFQVEGCHGEAKAAEGVQEGGYLSEGKGGEGAVKAWLLYDDGSRDNWYLYTTVLLYLSMYSLIYFCIYLWRYVS